MLNPAIGKLIEKHNDRYDLVLKVAECAREIAKEAQERDEILIEKPVSIAINKIASEEDVEVEQTEETEESE